MMRLLLSIMLAMVLVTTVTSCSVKDEKVTFVETQSSQLKVGQVWNYKTRSNETNSTLTICKIEAVGKLGTVVHVSVADVKVKSPQNKDGFATEIAHLPFAESAVKQSVTKLVKEGVALPKFQDGYDSWRNAVENGKGGVWTISVSEAVAVMETALNK